MEDLRTIVEQHMNAHRHEWPGHLAALDVRTWSDLIEHVEHELHAAVGRARAAGATWQDIGDALGVTRASAQQRFGKRRRQQGGEG